MNTCVCVLSNNGERLMPTFRLSKVRRLLKDGKPKIVKHHPFTIQLLYDSKTNTQPIEICEDVGPMTMFRTNLPMLLSARLWRVHTGIPGADAACSAKPLRAVNSSASRTSRLRHISGISLLACQRRYA